MVNNNADLDRIFAALSDGTRRGILAQLADGERSVAELAAPYAMSKPAISKHLRVLEAAGLVERVKKGRVHIIRARAEPAEAAGGWIAHYAQFWRRRFGAVDAYLKAAKETQGDGE
ncbi:MAG: metalloregulator ArsR/SmtB family transcription factor [Pseudomonadota bacterium]